MTALLEPAIAPVVPDEGRRLRIGGRSYPVVGPSVRDPRVALAVVILALQILGQTVLGFNVSIIQIILAIGTCAVIETGIAFWDRRAIIWPASAMQTGSGIGLIMRVPGTLHGEWWSTRGWSLFVGVSAFSVLSKHVIRWGDRHLFNPSNLGLVAAFVVLGTNWVDPQDLWWGPISTPVVSALIVIALGGVFVTRRAHVLRVTASFYVPFMATLAVLAASGHCMTARWAVGPVCGWHYWVIVITSPEILVFILFMITDPRTVPKGPTARTAFGVTIAVLGTLIAAPQHTEFGTKVGILAALVIACALRPLFERYIPEDAPSVSVLLQRWARSPRLVGAGVLALALVSGSIVAAGSPARDRPTTGLGTVVAGAAGERPKVDVNVSAPITIGKAADIAGSVDAPTARRAARQVLEDLSIEAEALRTGNAGLAATASYGTRLAQVEAAIKAGSGGTTTVTSYEPDHLTVLLVRGSTGAQAPPQVAVTLFATATAQDFVGGRPSGAVARTSAFARTFLLASGADAFLIGSEIDPVGGRGGTPA